MRIHRFQGRPWAGRGALLRACALAACALFGATLAGAAQTPEIAGRLSRLRDARISVDERERLCGELLGLGESGALALGRLAVEQAERAAKRAAGMESRYLGGFEKATVKLVGSRSSKARLAQVDEARSAVRKLSGNPELTKTEIQEVGDPAVETIKSVLEIEPVQVLEFSAALAAEREALSDAWFEASEWYDVWMRSGRVLGDDKRLPELVDPGPSWDAVGLEEAWLCALATPMSATDRKILVANRALAPQLDEEEAAGVLDLNRLRILLGLNALAIDVKLCNAARDHSNDMRTLGFFAHESPVPGKKTPGDRAARAGTSGGAENIAAGQMTGASANRAWWYSPGHHRNMLGSHSRIGLGRSETFWTQMFG